MSRTELQQQAVPPRWIFYRLSPDAPDRLGTIARTFVRGGLVTVGDLLVSRRASPFPDAGARADA